MNTIINIATIAIILALVVVLLPLSIVAYLSKGICNVIYPLADTLTEFLSQRLGGTAGVLPK